ncbi:unnamed protein product [Rotaria magnacalcarata]|nr:unnamed protein product [Rotaria magnacalcarata]
MSSNQFIDGLLVPINFIACSENNSTVKSSFLVPHDVATIQFIINDIKPIGGVKIGMTGPGTENNTSILKELGFSQAFYNSNRTLAQTASVALQLTLKNLGGTVTIYL